MEQKPFTAQWEITEYERKVFHVSMQITAFLCLLVPEKEVFQD